MKINANNRQKLLLIVAAAGVFLLVLDQLVFTPMLKSWQARTAEIAQLKKSVAGGRGVLERGPRTQGLASHPQLHLPRMHRHLVKLHHPNVVPH